MKKPPGILIALAVMLLVSVGLVRLSLGDPPCEFYGHVFVEGTMTPVEDALVKIWQETDPGVRDSTWTNASGYYCTTNLVDMDWYYAQAFKGGQQSETERFWHETGPTEVPDLFLP